MNSMMPPPRPGGASAPISASALAPVEAPSQTVGQTAIQAPRVPFDRTQFEFLPIILDGLRRLQQAGSSVSEADVQEFKRLIEVAKLKLAAAKADALTLPGADLTREQQEAELARLTAMLDTKRSQLEQFRSMPIFQRLNMLETTAHDSAEDAMETS